MELYLLNIKLLFKNTQFKRGAYFGALFFLVICKMAKFNRVLKGVLNDYESCKLNFGREGFGGCY